MHSARRVNSEESLDSKNEADIETAKGNEGLARQQSLQSSNFPIF